MGDKRLFFLFMPSDEPIEAGSAGTDRSASSSQNLTDTPPKLGRRDSVKSVSKSSQASSEAHSSLSPVCLCFFSPGSCQPLYLT